MKKKSQIAISDHHEIHDQTSAVYQSLPPSLQRVTHDGQTRKSRRSPITKPPQSKSPICSLNHERNPRFCRPDYQRFDVSLLPLRSSETTLPYQLLLVADLLLSETHATNGWSAAIKYWSFWQIKAPLPISRYETTAFHLTAGNKEEASRPPPVKSQGGVAGTTASSLVNLGLG